MPLDSKWATGDSTSTEQRNDKGRPPRKSKNVRSSTKGDKTKKDLDLGLVSDSTSSESEWSRPSSNSRGEIFDKGKGKKAVLSEHSVNENPLAKALGITLDEPYEIKAKKSESSPSKFKVKNHGLNEGKKNFQIEANATSTKLPTNSKKALSRVDTLKKRIDDQKKLLETKKHKAQQQQLVNNFLEGDSSFDWEDDESELIKKLTIKE